MLKAAEVLSFNATETIVSFFFFYQEKKNKKKQTMHLTVIKLVRCIESMYHHGQHSFCCDSIRLPLYFNFKIPFFFSCFFFLFV